MDQISEYLPESETELREFLSTSNPFYDYLMALKTELPHGADIIGAIGVRVKSLWKQVGGPEGGLDFFADRLVYAPGNRTLNFGDENTPAKVGLGIGISYDIWYLWQAGNVLKFGDKSQSETMEKMEPFFTSIDDAKPLKNPGGQSGGSGPPSGYGVGPVTSSGSDYVIKECEFETYLDGNGAANDSTGPSTGNKNDLAGYIAVPIGPLGVMWRISLASESSLSDGTGGGNVFPSSGDNHTTQGGELLPPFDFSVRETCGEMMMNKGYLLDDESTCELFADGDAPEQHKWLRYWIKKENTTIIPGEFFGILCRPWPLHCWWHQETAPFVYAGNWLETEFYASGIVKTVQTEEEYTGEDDEVGNRYIVWVKNEEITVKSSDFLEYEVDERVGILKTYRDGGGGPSLGGSMSPAGDGGGTTNFSHDGLELQNTEAELNTEWVIVPVDFYGTGGNSVGGS
jgi:hypothetical protein